MRRRYGFFPTFPADRTWFGVSTPGFNKGSRETPVERQQDKVLKNIDDLVKFINKERASGRHGRAQVLYADLFFATMFWINRHAKNSKMDDRRRNAIMSLQSRVGLILSQLYGLPAGAVGPKLKEIVGKGVVSEKQGGLNEGTAISRVWRESYRIVFINGYACRFDCLNIRNQVKDKLVFANSSDYYDFETQTFDNGSSSDLDGHYRLGKYKLCNYVLSVDNKLYLAPTQASGMNLPMTPEFHSNILANAPVRCSGTIGVERGIVKVITNQSGHYKPGLHRIRYVVDLLRMVGMQNVNNIDVRYELANRTINTCKAGQL